MCSDDDGDVIVGGDDEEKEEEEDVVVVVVMMTVVARLGDDNDAILGEKAVAIDASVKKRMRKDRIVVGNEGGIRI
jgi:hypothetical protein